MYWERFSEIDLATDRQDDPSQITHFSLWRICLWSGGQLYKVVRIENKKRSKKRRKFRKNISGNFSCCFIKLWSKYIKPIHRQDTALSKLKFHTSAFFQSSSLTGHWPGAACFLHHWVDFCNMMGDFCTFVLSNWWRQLSIKETD